MPARYFVLSTVLLVLLLFAFLRPATDTVRFQVIDRGSGRPLTNATAHKTGRWTSLPVERVSFGWLNPWRTTPLEAVDGSFEVHGVPRRGRDGSLVRISFYCYGYKPAMFTVVDEGFSVYHLWRSSTVCPRTNLVTIALEVDESVPGLPVF